MHIRLPEHFKKRYKKRVGYYSPKAIRKHLKRQLKNVPNYVTSKEAYLGEHFVVLTRKPGGAWIAKTIIPRKRDAGYERAFTNSSQTKAGSL